MLGLAQGENLIYGTKEVMCRKGELAVEAFGLAVVMPACYCSGRLNVDVTWLVL